jgi:hypothetical protein
LWRYLAGILPPTGRINQPRTPRCPTKLLCRGGLPCRELQPPRQNRLPPMAGNVESVRSIGTSDCRARNCSYRIPRVLHGFRSRLRSFSPCIKPNAVVTRCAPMPSVTGQPPGLQVRSRHRRPSAALQPWPCGSTGKLHRVPTELRITLAEGEDHWVTGISPPRNRIRPAPWLGIVAFL